MNDKGVNEGLEALWELFSRSQKKNEVLREAWEKASKSEREARKYLNEAEEKSREAFRLFHRADRASREAYSRTHFKASKTGDFSDLESKYIDELHKQMKAYDCIIPNDKSKIQQSNLVVAFP